MLGTWGIFHNVAYHDWFDDVHHYIARNCYLIFVFCLLQGHMQRVFLWSMSSIPLVISGYILDLLGAFSNMWIYFAFSIGVGVQNMFSFKQLMWVCLVPSRYSFLQTAIHTKLYVHYHRGIRLPLNHYFFHCKFLLLHGNVLII